MTEPTPDANWPSVWTLSAASMSSFSAYREAAARSPWTHPRRLTHHLDEIPVRQSFEHARRSSMAARPDKSHAPITTSVYKV